MKLKSAEKEKAVDLRIKGYSLSEISKRFGVASSSVSVWTRSVVLDDKAKSRINRIRKVALNKVRATNYKRAFLKQKSRLMWVDNILKNRRLTNFDYQIICSLLYWGEGAKFSDRLEFTNSDSEMVRVFLKSLEDDFGISRKNVRVNLYLHQYHNELKQKKFWANLLKISEKQFNKTFWKENSLKVKRQGYLGCIRICYNSKEIVDKVNLFCQQLSKLIGP